MNVLAQTAPATTQASSLSAFERSMAQWLVLPTRWPSIDDLMLACQQMSPMTATLLVVAGVIYLVWGQQMFKLLVILNCGFIGMWLGGMAGLTGGAAITGMFLGGFIAGAAAIPLMKRAVSLLAAAVGFAIGCAVWRLCGLDPAFTPAGGLVGLTFLFMLSFVAFRTTLITALGIQGAAMLMIGLISVGLQWSDLAPHISEFVAENQYVLPTAVFIPAVVGIIWQHSSPAAAPAPAKK